MTSENVEPVLSLITGLISFPILSWKFPFWDIFYKKEGFKRLIYLILAFDLINALEVKYEVWIRAVSRINQKWNGTQFYLIFGNKIALLT